MSDYISKSALINLFKDLADEHETNAISYKALNEVILQQPTIDEKEIIRKVFERVVERLGEVEKELTDNSDSVACTMGILNATMQARKILKEECGISD